MKAVKRKVYVSVVACFMACLMFAMPVMAASTNYFSKTTPKLNAINGNISRIASLSSGSVSGTERSITQVSLYLNVSSGSDPFDVHIVSPEGYEYVFTPSTTSKTYNITYFNGEDPKGTWSVYIENQGFSYNPNHIYPASTATATLKATYSYK